MNLLRRLFVTLAALTLAACGGGGGDKGTSSFVDTPPPTTASAATVEVLSSASTVSTGGTEVTITALVKNNSNAAVPAAVVAFATDTGTLLGVPTVADASGVASARFTAGADRSNRTAKITVTSGSVSGSVAVDIVGSQMQIAGAQSLVIGATTELRITATDGASKPLSGVSVAVKSTLGNGLSNAAPVTDSQGVAKLTYTATNPGADAVEFQAAGLTSTLAIQVTRQENLAFVAPGSSGQIVALNTPTPVVAEYRVNGLPATGNYRVRFASTSGTLSPAEAATGIAIGADGRATASITSTFAGPATVQATLVSGADGTVVAQTQVAMQFVARTPAAIVLQATPKSVGPNLAGSTTNQIQVRATVTDAAGNPVQGAVVNFSKLADSSGGNLSEASSVTDSNGQATVRYVAGPTSTAADGVRLLAVIADNVAVRDEETLTVDQNALFIALGTGNVITNYNETTYEKVWTVYVTDASGAAIPNQQVTISVLPTRYAKGSFTLVLDDYATGEVAETETGAPLGRGSYVVCPNEDLNYNGVVDAGEDRNTDGRLQAGNVISVNGGSNVTTVATDSNGFALLRLRYAESYAFWVEVKLRASALVGGTESSNEVVFFAPGLKSDYTKDGGPPAGLFSPFGQYSSCRDPR